jgi:hypothetical protein
MNFAPTGPDLVHKGLQLRAVAPAGENRETFGSEFLGDLGPDIIAGADHCDSRVSLLHGSSPS